MTSPEVVAEIGALASRLRFYAGSGNAEAYMIKIDMADAARRLGDLLAENHSLREEVEHLKSERSTAMALLAPVSSEETLEGAIRNLQQQAISEAQNAETLERRCADIAAELALRTIESKP